MSDLTARQIFSEVLPARLQANPDKAKATNAVYQFDISGEHGGTWTLDFTKDADFVSEGAQEGAQCILGMSDTDFVSMWEGKLPGAMAMMSGKLKIKGNMGLAMKLQSFIG